MNSLTVLSLVEEHCYRLGRFVGTTLVSITETDHLVLLRNTVKILVAVSRFVLLFLNSLYSISAHCMLIMLLKPLQMVNDDLYWTIEDTMYDWILCLTSFWVLGTHYSVVEMGDSLETCRYGSCLILVNHQSTADVPLMMSVIQGQKTIKRYMWIMDWFLRYTSFGLVSHFHRDFFILSGLRRTEEARQLLKDHLLNEFIPTKKQFIILFPEGGFLRKRRNISKEYALQHNITNTICNVALPRTGAFTTICQVLSGKEVLIDEDRKLKWIIDITVAYEDGIPLDIFSYILHWNDPCTTYIFYRVYEAAEVPEDENGMITWLYNLWETKENILNLFYSKIMPLKFNAYHKNKLGDLLQPTKLKPDFLKIILINIFHITAIYLNYRFVCYIISYIF